MNPAVFDAENKAGARRPFRSLHRAFGLASALVFAAVGAILLLIPEGVLEFFNGIAAGMGMKAVPAENTSFFLALSAAYMSMVTFLAWRMFRRPDQAIYPLLLAQAKWASAGLSLFLFIVRIPALILLVNFVADGLIGAAAFYLYKKSKGSTS